ncbi:hypothetical protein [Sulfoacidibacillus ferrooxidans]|uniref:Uncharacterized protein n=1 Tax=Sulfoacidibacillus ferrooxidans TaxID=2005001 RepID=A0A9X1VBD5_9BACL|nr:hypothetical protein [Sulfoacidibacillus ferrooxidans]MCI0184938.1 hypothetical protein [Sulfoacidibacillus ferrooxidans]
MNPSQFQQQLQQSLAIHPFNPQTLVDQATSGFIHLILIGFDWIYLVAELGVLFGAIVFLIGAAVHQSRWKGTGTRILFFSIAGFVIGTIGPGIVLSINDYFH